MKSFSQFLEESYLNEEPAGRPAKKRTGGPTPGQVKELINKKEAEAAARKAARKPSGAAARPDLQFKPKGTTTTVSSPATSSAPAAASPGATRANLQAPPVRTTPTAPAASSPAASPGATRANLQAPPVRTTPTGQVKPPGATRADLEVPRKPLNITRPLPSNTPAPGKLPSGPKLKIPAGAGKALRIAGRLAGPAAAALDVADERAKGSGWLRSGLKAATVAAGGALGGAAGSVVAPGAGTFVGGAGGAIAASKAFDTVAGANAAQRKAMATANRQRQSGTALKGIGGQTTFDTKKNTMTTGVGPQRKTVQLAKTSVITGPKGKQETGYLAYKGGQAVYKRAADPSTLAKTSSNWLERVGRIAVPGAYAQNDAKLAAQKLAQARQSDVQRQKALGVKMKPGG